MVDSPKFTPRLVNWLKERGGLRYIFLTHRDDVAEAHRFATEFGAKRIIHRGDLEAQKEAEIVMDGDDDLVLDPDFVIIATPGHTPGHCMLNFRETFLFTGDVFTSKTRYGDNLEVWDPFYCWGSWEEQLASIERLRRYCFQWILPSHGRRYKADSKEKMTDDLEKCILRAGSETETFPCTAERIAFFERYIPILEQAGQPDYARKMSETLERMKSRLA
jgi:glyoxylase-like metal-dependent hydrolase (beta-lactamase superfamily II)